MKKLLILGLLLITLAGCGHCGKYAEVVDLETNRVIATYDDIRHYYISGDPIITLYRGSGGRIQIATGNKVLTVRIKQGQMPR